MNASHIIGYTYNAAIHCPACARRAFHHGLDDGTRTDREGNNVAPVFAVNDDGATYCDSCGHAVGRAAPVVRVLSVDAWRDGNAWTWNNWHARGFVPLAWCDLKPRALLRALRDANCYTLPAPGRAAIEDDGYNVVVVMKGTREPLLALAYGEAV